MDQGLTPEQLALFWRFSHIAISLPLASLTTGHSSIEGEIDCTGNKLPSDQPQGRTPRAGFPPGGSGGGKALNATGRGWRDGSLIPPVPPCGLQAIACDPPTAGRELGLFSGSIPPWFVLSSNLSTTNTRAIWLCFGAFLPPPASSLQFHWPLITILPSHAPRPTPGPAGSGRAQTLPRWLQPDTDSRIGKDRTGPDRDERSLSFSMAPNRAIPTE